LPGDWARVGGRPILCHILDLYAAQGFDDFVIAAGYKHEVIEDYFAEHTPANYRVQVVDTGELTMTGGRLLRLACVTSTCAACSPSTAATAASPASRLCTRPRRRASSRSTATGSPTPAPIAPPG
jgi:hypothetical protein